MSKYPDIITDAILQSSANITEDEILKDICDTNAEIVIKERECEAYAILARHDRMASFRLDAARRGVIDRKAFVEFLVKLLNARKVTNEPSPS